MDLGLWLGLGWRIQAAERGVRRRDQRRQIFAANTVLCDKCLEQLDIEFGEVRCSIFGHDDLTRKLTTITCLICLALSAWRSSTTGTRMT